MAVQLVRPILRFTGDRTIQLDGFETVLSAILVHKTAHEGMVVVSGTIRILKHRLRLRAIWRIGLLCSSRDQPIERPPNAADPTRTDGEGDNECAAPQTIVLHGSPPTALESVPVSHANSRDIASQCEVADRAAVGLIADVTQTSFEGRC